MRSIGQAVIKLWSKQWPNVTLKLDLRTCPLGTGHVRWERSEKICQTPDLSGTCPVLRTCPVLLRWERSGRNLPDPGLVRYCGLVRYLSDSCGNSIKQRMSNSYQNLMKLAPRDHINSRNTFPKDFPKKVKFSSRILRNSKKLGFEQELTKSSNRRC